MRLSHGHLKDVRQRLANHGAAALSVVELVTLVTGGGAVEIPGEGLVRLAGATPSRLRWAGLGAAAAASLCAAFELGRRVGQEEAPAGIALRSASAAYEYLRPRIAHLQREVFVVLLLDVRLRVLGDEKIAEGTGWACAVHPRDVLAPALREGAAAVVFAHNHPSGDPTPSAEDRDLTRRLLRASELMGVRAVDHLVVTQRAFASFRDLGLWDGAPREEGDGAHG